VRRGFGRQGGIVPFRHSGLPARSRFGEGRRKPESNDLKEEFDVYTITALLLTKINATDADRKIRIHEPEMRTNCAGYA
jgi:hypothetical protein